MRRLLFFSLVLLFIAARPVDVKYHIEPASRLRLQGTTNVNKFSCQCGDYRDQTQGRVRLQVTAEGEMATFEGATLRLPTKGIDCGHQGINRDLYQTLKADRYHHISITLLKARAMTQGGEWPLKQWRTFQAAIDLTIAGVTRRAQLDIKAQRLDDHRFRFTGAHGLLMTEFGLEPPTAMLGMIKVRDRITIELDLVVKVEP